MKSEEYRKLLEDSAMQYRIGCTLQQLSKTNKYDFLIDIFMNSKLKDCTYDDLYKINSLLFQLKVNLEIISNEIIKNNLIISGEFEDKKMSFEELGADTTKFICSENYYCETYMLNIQKGTKIEIIDLHFKQFVSVKIMELITDCTNKKILDAISGLDKIIVSLKDLGLYYKPSK
jgi:hypothetical protein